jgi:hypothetical protein
MGKTDVFLCCTNWPFTESGNSFCGVRTGLLATLFMVEDGILVDVLTWVSMIVHTGPFVGLGMSLGLLVGLLILYRHFSLPFSISLVSQG